MKIRDLIEVIPQPAVVRLDQLSDEAAGKWISDNYYITEETERHLSSFRSLLRKRYGCGVFLIGHYGSGKSHFLAYLTQQIRNGSFSKRQPHVIPISLLNFKSIRGLESIIEEAVGEPSSESDRRLTWERVAERNPDGLVLLLDELSEFLRSKASVQSFNEDIRFLQFLGEWSQDHTLWIIAALQEQIEHAGEIEYDLYRKIKDRYPIRYILTPTHVKSLIGGKILRKKQGYQTAVEKLASSLREIFPGSSIDLATLTEVYPLHPATLDLLEEVRDRFSQARGIVDFTLTQLLGNEARSIAPFLDQPWGHLISPDVIVDHFQDLLEVQPDFQALAQKVFPFYRRHMSELFDKPLQQTLAWRLLKLLVLVHLSPARKALDLREATEWLLFKISTIDPQKNVEVIERALKVLATEGSYVKKEGSRFRLDVEDDSRQSLERLLARTVEELRGRGDTIFETLIPCLRGEEFNPFSLPRDRWHSRNIRWHFHDREIRIYFGGGQPVETRELSIQIGLPWGPPADGKGCFRVIPRALELSPEVVELAALFHLRERPLTARVLKRVEERIAGRKSWFCALVRSAYTEATVMSPSGAAVSAPLGSRPGQLEAWLNSYGEWLLRQTYPQFERFAPGHGPLPRDAYREFMRHAVEHDLCSEPAPEFVRLIREAYLVPMNLIQRKGIEYTMSAKLDQHELVTLLTPILQHHPSVARVHQHMSGPVYGLVPDQINLLLITLLVMGEIDIQKGNRSYRNHYEVLSNPIQYDRIIPGQALNTNQLRDLQLLCENLGVRVPKQWSVLAQRRAIEALKKELARRRDQASEFQLRLRAHGDAAELPGEVEKFIAQSLAIEEGDELQGFQHFLYRIESPRAFVNRAAELATLPERFDRLLRETERFRHLFSYSSVVNCPDKDISVRLEALGVAPTLADPEGLENWLNNARDFYDRYKTWYRERHDAWWERIRRHSIWAHRSPDLAYSKHLAVEELIREIESLQSKARAEACTDIASLEFQPFCRCGFDGNQSPLADTLTQFDQAAQKLETEMVLFFGQPQVKARVKAWVDQGLECNTRTLSYVEGRADYPEIENLKLFDQHLSGLELVRTLESDTLLELFADRTWQKPELMRKVEQLFERYGPRLTISREPVSSRRSLVAWCVEQALKLSIPLPTGFSAEERKLIAEVIRPEWVSQASLAKLGELQLGDEAVDTILRMIIEGIVQADRQAGQNSAVGAAIELLNNTRPTTIDEYVKKIGSLYSQHERFMQIRPKEWLARLDELANSVLEVSPESIVKLLSSSRESQWIVIDCFGVVLLDVVKESVKKILGRWRIADISYGLVSTTTNTSAFYTSLIEDGVNKPLNKIDAIDTLVHERKGSPSELIHLARAELEVSLRRVAKKLDPAKSVTVFGDHGFRLASDGRTFVHGGPSTLERLVPILKLEPNESDEG